MVKSLSFSVFATCTFINIILPEAKYCKYILNLQHWLLQPLQLEVSEAMQSSDILQG
jgi:hypothetical protein